MCFCLVYCTHAISRQIVANTPTSLSVALKIKHNTLFLDPTTMTANTHPYDDLTPDLVIEAVEALGYWSDARLLALNSYENRVYQVGIEDEKPLIAKFYRPERWTQEQIREDHQFCQQLAKQDLPIVPPIIDAQGETLHEHKGFLYSLFPRHGGQAPELDNLETLYTLGCTLGRMHQIGKSQKFTSRPSINVDTFGWQSRAFLLDNQWLPSHLALDYEHLSKELLDIVDSEFKATNGVSTLRLHGDCHPGNILWRDDKPNFVDFDDSRTGPAIQDLWMLTSGDRLDQHRQMSEVLDGYEEFCDFNRAELRLIEPLRVLRIMHYAAWLARRWEDPAFPTHFPWFDQTGYWESHLIELQELKRTLLDPDHVLRLGY